MRAAPLGRTSYCSPLARALALRSSKVVQTFLARQLQQGWDCLQGSEHQMAHQWQFEQDEQQQWHWQHLEKSEKSERSFASAAECMLDAVRKVVTQRRAQVEITGQNLLQ